MAADIIHAVKQQCVFCQAENGEQDAQPGQVFSVPKDPVYDASAAANRTDREGAQRESELPSRGVGELKAYHHRKKAADHKNGIGEAAAKIPTRKDLCFFQDSFPSAARVTESMGFPLSGNFTFPAFFQLYHRFWEISIVKYSLFQRFVLI